MLHVLDGDLDSEADGTYFDVDSDGGDIEEGGPEDGRPRSLRRSKRISNPGVPSGAVDPTRGQTNRVPAPEVKNQV